MIPVEAWLLLVAIALVVALFAAIRLDQIHEKQRRVIAEAEIVGSEAVVWIEDHIRMMAHIANRTRFGVKALTYRDGRWPWQKCYKAGVIIYYAEPDDKKKIELVAVDAVQKYRSEPGNSIYEVVIHLVPQGKSEAEK